MIKKCTNSNVTVPHKNSAGIQIGWTWDAIVLFIFSELMSTVCDVLSENQ